MKIAIFHDFIGTIGGGEKLVLTLAEDLKADIITTDMNIEAIKNMEFENINIISLGDTIKLSLLKQISASIKFALCNFSDKYDFFIFSGNWAYFAAKKHKPNLLYCHTPVRGFYDTYELTLQRQNILLKPFFIMWVSLHRPISEYYMSHVENIVTNSRNTLSKINKYLKRNAEVIYPPIDISKYHFKKFGDFWLSVNRLYPEKRIELQIEAFRLMPEEKLIIIGDYAKGDHIAKYVEKLMKNLPKNVEIIRAIPEKELINLYENCKGLITTAINEDFGMTPVEAMAAGKPVIAVKEGYLETIIENETGILIEPKINNIINAAKFISNSEIGKYRGFCEERAKKFDRSIFIKRMKKYINEEKS